MNVVLNKMLLKQREIMKTNAFCPYLGITLDIQYKRIFRVNNYKDLNYCDVKLFIDKSP